MVSVMIGELFIRCGGRKEINRKSDPSAYVKALSALDKNTIPNIIYTSRYD